MNAREQAKIHETFTEKNIHFMQKNMHNCVDFYGLRVYNIIYNGMIMTTLRLKACERKQLWHK